MRWAGRSSGVLRRVVRYTRPAWRRWPPPPNCLTHPAGEPDVVAPARSGTLPAVDHDRKRFVELALSNEINRAVLERAPRLGVPDWWLTAGALFQTVWNRLDGRAPTAGIQDYDLFYFDPTDLSWDAEDQVIRSAGALFADLDATVEVRNEARVHLWYEEHFGVPAPAFRSSCDAVDHFASTTCCYAITRATDEILVYAPHGYTDLFAQRVRPNPRLAPREVYEAKAARWATEWPGLTVDPWPEPSGSASLS